LGVHSRASICKEFLSRVLCKERTTALFEINRTQMKKIIWLFTEHYHLKGKLFKLGLAKTPPVKVSMTKPKQLHTSHVSVKLKLSQDLVM
jgi:hypothetical protein